MFVTVIHRIHDPEGFQATEAKALEATRKVAGRVREPDRAFGVDRRLGDRRSERYRVTSHHDTNSQATLEIHS